MITKSDSRELREVAISLLNLGEKIEEQLGLELLRAGADVVVVVTHRIRQEGKDADGAILDTRAKKRVGRYSSSHAKTRLARGRQVERKDLTFTGEMLLNYNLTEQEPRRVGTGFLSERSHEIAGYLEDYQRQEIFIPSEEEENEILADAMERIEKLIDQV